MLGSPPDTCNHISPPLGTVTEQVAARPTKAVESIHATSDTDRLSLGPFFASFHAVNGAKRTMRWQTYSASCTFRSSTPKRCNNNKSLYVVYHFFSVQRCETDWNCAERSSTVESSCRIGFPGEGFAPTCNVS